MELNCSSLALKFDFQGADDPDFILSRKIGISGAISDMAHKHNRKIRELESENSPLMEGEWMICFIGFWEEKLRWLPVSIHEYHFALKNGDMWIERDRGTEVCLTSLEDLRAFARKKRLPVLFYAASVLTETAEL